ncbi:hypothetical protein JHK85_018695 [Glycine max]|nr:hypothetical protein JHK85_018695 [Glycine max]
MGKEMEKGICKRVNKEEGPKFLKEVMKLDAKGINPVEESSDLDKSAHMKKFFKPEDMKVLMSTWEELDNTSSDEEIKEEEEANLCVMVALHRKDLSHYRNPYKIHGLIPQALKIPMDKPPLHPMSLH